LDSKLEFILSLLTKKHMKTIKIILLGSLISAQTIPHFDGDVAFSYLKKQCEFGPRYPGSKAHIDVKNYFINFLENKADSLIVYEHKINHPYQENEITLYNILAKYNLESKNRILLMAHWDTREIADKDEKKDNQNKPIVGANDGASGVAILMLLSEIFSDFPFDNIGVDLLFVDGEDMGRKGDLNNFCLGTKLFSKHANILYYKLAICLDMVADKDPEFKMEYFSYIQAEKELKEIWSLANSLGYGEFNHSLSQPIYDDHRALYVETGIPSIDIIDFDYPYWHTLDDTADKCSAKTLNIVGNVMCEYLYRKEQGSYYE